MAQELQETTIAEQESQSSQAKVVGGRTKQVSRTQRLTQRRSKQERLIDIIRVIAANGPLRRTHILYKANLTWGELSEDLNVLEKVGAIRMMQNSDGTFYGSTELGLEILNHSSRISTILTGKSANI